MNNIAFSKTINTEGSSLLCYVLHHMANSQELPEGLNDSIFKALEMAGYDASTGDVKFPMVINDWATHADHKLFPTMQGKFSFSDKNIEGQ